MNSGVTHLQSQQVFYGKISENRSHIDPKADRRPSSVEGEVVTQKLASRRDSRARKVAGGNRDNSVTQENCLSGSATTDSDTGRNRTLRDGIPE